MARFKAVRTGSTVVLLLLLNLALGFGGLVLFDYFGFIDARQLVQPVLGLVGINQPEPMENSDAVDLLDQERFKKQQDQMLLWEEELAQREQEIVVKESEIQQVMEALDEKEKALEEQEVSFNDRVARYDDRKTNLRQSSIYFNGMPPLQAVERMLEMDDQDVIDLLRTTEEISQETGAASMVSYWLSLMPSTRAADLSRKMLKKPSDS